MFCSLEIEDTLHYLLHCHHFNHIRIDLMNSVKPVYDNFESLSHKDKKDILLYGASRLDIFKKNTFSSTFFRAPFPKNTSDGLLLSICLLHCQTTKYFFFWMVLPCCSDSFDLYAISNANHSISGLYLISRWTGISANFLPAT